jgi:hypothetical protein
MSHPQSPILCFGPQQASSVTLPSVRQIRGVNRRVFDGVNTSPQPTAPGSPAREVAFSSRREYMDLIGVYQRQLHAWPHLPRSRKAELCCKHWHLEFTSYRPRHVDIDGRPYPAPLLSPSFCFHSHEQRIRRKIGRLVRSMLKLPTDKDTELSELPFWKCENAMLIWELKAVKWDDHVIRIGVCAPTDESKRTKRHPSWGGLLSERPDLQQRMREIARWSNDVGPGREIA